MQAARQFHGTKYCGPVGRLSSQAIGMARRLARAIEEENGRKAGRPQFSVRAGYEAVKNVREEQIEAHDLLERAAIAMRRTRPNGEDGWIQPFDQEGPFLH